MHEKIQGLLVKYNNEQCTEEEYAVVKAHLKECDECKKMLMEMRFDISYDPKEVSFEVDIERDNKTTEYEEDAGRSVDVQGNVNDEEDGESKGESNDDGLIGDNKETTGVQHKTKMIALIVAAVAVVVVIGIYSLNRYMAVKVCREFMKAYDAAFIIPEEYISSDGAVNRIMFNKEKEARLVDLQEYCAGIEDESIENMFAILKTSLAEQANGEASLITETDEITNVKVDKISFSNAEVTVRFGSVDDGYSYHIFCEKSGYTWLIKSAELSIVSNE